MWLCGTYGVHYTPCQHPAERQNNETKLALLLAKSEITDTCALKMRDQRGKNMPVTSKENKNKEILELVGNEKKPPKEDND